MVIIGNILEVAVPSFALEVYASHSIRIHHGIVINILIVYIKHRLLIQNRINFVAI